jgi:tetratricopeptide (TPR) repeat protein
VARDAYETALSIQPGVGVGHRGLGRALEALGQVDAAIDQYRKAIAVDERDVVSLNNAAWLLLEMKKRPDDALALAIRAEKIAPRFVPALDTLGWAHYRRGSYADAETFLARAVERAPGNAAIQYHLGMTYYRLGKKTDAVAVLRRASQLDPKLAQAEKIDSVIRELGG